jgi:hypothetical protein
MARKRKAPGKTPVKRAQIELIGFTDKDESPDMAVYAVDKAFKVIEMSKVDSGGMFRLSQKALDSASRIVVGAQAESIADVDRSELAVYRSTQFKNIIAESGRVEIAKGDWIRWIHIKRCVSGSVKKCFPYPVLISQIARQADIALKKSITTRTLALRATAADSVTDARIATPLQPFIPLRKCDTVCDGVVEVYRRTCCCHPWVMYDPRIPELIEELEELIPEIPPIPWPPRPEPDPAPFERLPFFKSGALDEKVLNAKQDLHALHTLSAQEVPAYIMARPYLFCSCGSATKVAQGTIRPDGKFHICWFEAPRLLLINCHDEYAYVVKQNIDGSTVTIYDGVAAHKWFHYNDDAELVSYHLLAQSCRHNDFPGTGAFALLQDIGLTNSYRLKTPDATGWDRVAAPLYNDGLAYPAANAAAAKGKYLDRNWGGTLLLRYHFSEAMKGVGAKYYRVSVAASDGNGNPTGGRTYLAPRSWKYFEVIGTDIFIRKIPLGPHSAGGQNNLYEIPYDADRDWLSGQYHADLGTTEFANGRHLVTVEVFNSSGKLIRPTGTPDPGGSVQGAFTYRRWYQETGPTAEVPFAALTHMFWWDNREAVANIVDLRVNGSPNTQECQFLVGPGNTNFSVGYRAYHPNPLFLLDHRIWWRRGLGGPSGILTSPHPNPDNVGVPPGLPHQSGADTFSSMLGSHVKCSFTINLHSNVKTFNGIGTLNGRDDWDQAAFALEIV